MSSDCDGNIDDDPMFVDAENGDYRLQAESPCINAGSNECVTWELDLDGNPRIINGRVDMGVYEFRKDWVGPEDGVLVIVPYAWLDLYRERLGLSEYVNLALSTGVNGRAFWDSYVAGLDPADSASRFVTSIDIRNGVPHISWTPNYEKAQDSKKRIYSVEGKTNLTDRAWHFPTNDATRFFRVKVKLTE